MSMISARQIPIYTRDECSKIQRWTQLRTMDFTVMHDKS